MKCVTCSSTDRSLLKLQTFVDNNTLKEIFLVLPDFKIPSTQGPVYVCITCQEQVTKFYKLKKAGLENLHHLNLYEDILKTSSDVKYNDLKIKIDNNTIVPQLENTIVHQRENTIVHQQENTIVHQRENTIVPQREQLNEFKWDPNSGNFSNEGSQLIKKEFNLSDIEDSQKQSSSEKNLYTCHDCDKVFTCRSNLVRHIRVHTGIRPYNCLICQKVFTTSGNLKEHQLIHAGEKPHECDICHKTFTQKSTLIAHKRTHSNVRPYQCIVCGQAFTQSGDLNIHMRSHTGEKPYQCHFCHYKCARAGHLKIHIRTHTGEKPYSCKFCQKSFSRSNWLKVHKRRKHSNEVLNGTLET